MKTKENTGITLIALVLTIIVLLILSGISISMLTGENGILTRAKEAKTKTELAIEKEQLQMAITEALTENNNILTKEKLQNTLAKINNETPNIVENTDGSFTIAYSQKIYYINTNKSTIIDKNLKISSASDLKKLRDDVNLGNSYKECYIYLENDIYLPEEENWTPIGYYSDEIENNVEFYGIFDGRGNKIHGLNVSNENERYHGLFGYNKGTIMNLEIASDSTILGKGNTGAIVGYNVGSVINCKSEATIQSNYNNTGGVVGKNDGLVSSCINGGNVLNTGKVVGGVVGWNTENGKIEKSSNISEVETKSYMVGGVVGSNDGIVTECFNLSKVIGNTTDSTNESSSGGIAGYNKRRNNKML